VGAGTKCKLSAECRLARGNPQWPGVLDWFSQSKISGFNFLVDLKEQPTHSELAGSGIYKIFRLKMG
jgi:hypothetical protein